MTKVQYLDPAKEAQAVAAIMAAQQIDASEDPELVAGTIEGETSFFEAIDAVLDRIANAEVMLEGLDAVIEKLKARRTRYELQIKHGRTLIEQAMSIAELDKIERPAATLSLSTRAPSLQVLEESDIPARYWKPGAPTLDKKALTADLKDRAKAIAEGADTIPDDIPGAALSNGAPSLTLRRA